MTADQLGAFDVIVSNWNNFNEPELQWSDACRKAFLDFVRNGKGHVTIHAGGSSFAQWKEYHDIAACWVPQTGHGRLHDFAVKPTNIAHPITQGVQAFQTRDELWHKAYFPPQSTMLMIAFSSKDQGGSGEDEPVLATNRFGRGRCVNFMLGHDGIAMRNHGFDTLLLRSVEWAARGSTEITSTIENVPAGVRYFQKTDHSVALISNGKVVWQFNYDKKQTKPYFHPVSLTDGTRLTWEAPPDHPWHYGLWFSWKFINGVNYWEEDAKTGKAAGITEWDMVRIHTHADGSAEITLDVSYHEPDKPNVLTEKRSVAISAPDDSGSYTMDWTTVFTAAAEKVELNRTPLPDQEGGRSWGGYAGLSFRGRKGAQEVLFTTTKGPATLTDGRFRGKDVACEYSGIVNDKVFGVAILDHPDNLNCPTPWYLIHDKTMDFFSPAVICYAPHTMSQGETLTLKYRISIHPGRWDSIDLKKEHERFASHGLLKK